MTTMTSPDVLVAGPGYTWRLYIDGGIEYAALYLEGHLVRREGRRWWHAGDKGERVAITIDKIATLRGTQPDTHPVWPEQAEIALPPELADNPGTSDLLQAIGDEYGLVGPDAWKMAGDVLYRIHSEQATGLARRIVRDEQLEREADLATIEARSVAHILDQPREPRVPLFGQLLAEGHNATVVAKWKVGKSTFVDNAAIAAASAGMFLGRFETPAPLRVVLFNYELHDDDMADRLAALKMPTSAAANITVINLRGRRLPISTTRGRDITIHLLADAGADLWIVDPFGAAFAAAGGQDENNNAEVRRFLIALDEIKRLANCASLLMPVHTGRRADAEGDEQGRGATVLEDWPDVRMLLTRGPKEQRQHRFLRTEGRAWELDESRLTFDETTRRLSLSATDVGVSRRRAKTFEHAQIVADLVAEEPGANTRRLVDLLAEHGVTNNSDKSDAIKAARERRLVHWHRVGSSQAHFAGEHHTDSDPCPGGFTA